MERWQIHRRAIPWLKGLVFSAGFLLLLYILPPLIFSIPAVQRSVAEAVEAELEHLLQTKVSLGRVTLHEWNDISIEHLIICDSLGREALRLGELRAGFEWRRLLLDERVHVSSIRLFSPHLDLFLDGGEGKLNISPILERLSSGDTTSRTSLGLQSLLVRDGSVRLTTSEGRVVEVDSITLNLSRLVVEEPFYGCNIQEISLRYARALELRQFSGQIQMQGSHLSLSNLQGELSSGRVHIPHLRLNMGAKGWDIVEEVRVSGIYFALSDLNPLLAGEELPTAQASLSGTISRLGGGLRIDSLNAGVAGWLSMRSDAVVELDAEGQILGVHAPHLELRGRADSFSRSDWGAKLLGGSLSGALVSLGEVHYLGDVAWLVGDGFGANGRMTSSVGGIDLRDVFVGVDSLGAKRIEGEVSTQGFDLGVLLGHESPISKLSGNVRGDLRRGLSEMDWRGDVALQVDYLQTRGSRFSNINLGIVGKGDGRFSSEVKSLDPAVSFSGELSARATASGLEDISFRLSSPRLVPAHFVGGEDMLSFEHVNVEGELSALDLRSANGQIRIHSLELRQGGEQIDLGSSWLYVHRQRDGRQLSLQTPWLALDVQGHYYLDDIWRRVLHSLYRSSPLLEDLAPPRERNKALASSATLSLRLDSIPLSLERILRLPMHVPSPVHISGEYEEATDHFALALEGTELELLGKRIRSLKLEMNETGLDARASEVKPLEGDPLLSPSLSIDHLGDSLRINLNIGKDPDVGENGYVNLDARLLSRSHRVRSLEDLEAQISLSPSRMRIHSAVWSVDPAQIHVSSEGLRMHGFLMRTEGRSISMDGTLGSVGSSTWMEPIEPLTLKLERINLRYILSAVGVDFSMLEMDLSGRIWAGYNDGVLNARGQVYSPHFFLEGRDTGALVADLRFDTKEANINLQAEVTDSIGGSTLVAGYIRPSGGAGMDLHFEAEGFHLGFVQTFLSGVFNKVDGRGTGHVRLFGQFEQGVTIEGGLSVQGGVVSPSSLGTEYYFDDEVSFKPEEMNFTGIRLRDDNGGTAQIGKGIVRHKYFDDFVFDLLVDNVNKMKVLDLPTKGALPVYGRAYASGESRIRGGNGRIFISNTLRSEEGTDVTLDFNNSSFEAGNRFMRFVSLRDTTRQVSPLELEQEDGSTPIDMHYKISLHPTAKVALRLGASERDVIKGWGEGEVRIDVPHTGSSMVNGELTVHGGQYDFRLKQLMYKQLSLHEGGRIILQGDPYQAQLDLKASYELQANIADLDEQLSRQVGQTNIPVQCIVNIVGTVGKPELKLELGLPRVDSEVERRIRSIVNTEEEANRQFLSLFVLGRFYTSGSNPTASNSSSNTLAALASTLISDQLTSFIGNLSNKVRLGTSVRVGGANFEDTEIGLNYTINLLNNRFLLRGNFGYHESALQDNGTYLTEFDAEYRLSRTLSLRAYNHYNTMYRYLRGGATTQGLGIRFRQTYDRFSEIFRPLYKASDSIPPVGGIAPSDSLQRVEATH